MLMRKLLLSLAAMMFTFMASAQVVFNFDEDYATLFPSLAGVSTNDGATDGDITEALTATLGGVNVTVSAAAEGASTANRIWSGSPRLRMYSGTLTVSAPGHKVTSVEFDAPSKFDVTVAEGTLSGKQWTGSEDQVVFTINKNTQIKKLTVTLDVAVDEQPSEPEYHIANTPDAPYTVAQANELIAAGKGLDDKVYVKGIITSINEVSLQYGNATYFISDDGTENGQLEVFRGYAGGGEKFTSEDEIAVGDVVIVYGKLTNYNGTYEFTTGSQIYYLEHTSTPGITIGDPVDATAISGEYEIDYLTTPDQYSPIQLVHTNITVAGQADGSVTITGMGASPLNGIYRTVVEEGYDYNIIVFGDEYLNTQDQEYPSYAQPYENAILFSGIADTQTGQVVCADGFAVRKGEYFKAAKEVFTCSISSLNMVTGEPLEPMTSTCYLMEDDGFPILLNMAGFSFVWVSYADNGDIILDYSQEWPYCMDFASDEEADGGIRLTKTENGYVYEPEQVGVAMFGPNYVLSITLTKNGANAVKSLSADTVSKGFYYNLQGQQSAAARKGINIQGGKKFVVK